MAIRPAPKWHRLVPHCHNVRRDPGDGRGHCLFCGRRFVWNDYRQRWQVIRHGTWRALWPI